MLLEHAGGGRELIFATSDVVAGMRSWSKVQQFRVADLIPIGLAVRGGVP
jgi:hypothetical protein